MPSNQAIKWRAFADAVEQHIEKYVIPQYGDEGEEPAVEYDARDCMTQAKRYIARFQKSSRDGEEKLDMMKAAHWIQKTWDRL